MSESSEYPMRTTRYQGWLVDTDRWNSFSSRVGDIFICTPPKCGTTWTQAICANLIFGSSQFDGKLTDISPWIDSKIESEDVCRRTLESQTHRRFIKTHTPLDGIPYFDSAQYLVVYRDPKDTYFSLRNHLLNMQETPDIPQLAENPRQGFLAWLEDPFQEGVGEQRSLEAFTRHFSSFWDFRHLENIHFLHYSDFKNDLDTVIRQIANILKTDLPESRVREICKAVSFTAMKENAGTYAPAAGKSMFKSDEAFFNNGNNAQWRGVLDKPEIEKYERRLRQLLSPDAVKWLDR